MEIQKQLKLEAQNQITASVTIQWWYHDISYQCLELEQELLLLRRFGIHQLNVDKHLSDNEHWVTLEVQQWLELDNECFLLDKTYLEEQVTYFQHDYFPIPRFSETTTINYIGRSADATTIHFNGRNGKVHGGKRTKDWFATAESSLPFLHDKQYCELMATVHPFHISMETAPPTSICNTDW